MSSMAGRDEPLGGLDDAETPYPVTESNHPSASFYQSTYRNSA
jgi:hypothetical protein